MTFQSGSCSAFFPSYDSQKLLAGFISFMEEGMCLDSVSKSNVISALTYSWGLDLFESVLVPPDFVVVYVWEFWGYCFVAFEFLGLDISTVILSVYRKRKGT